MEKVFLQLVNMSIQASYLIIAVIIARFFLRKAPKYMSCFLWILVGIRLICPISIESVFSLIPNQQSIDQSVTLGQNSNMEVNFTNQSGKTESDLKMEKVEAVLPITAADSTSENIIITILLTIVWIIGMVILFIYSVWSYLRLKRKVATAIPRELNGSKVYECEEINSPFLLGIIRPSIYIPIDIAEKDLSYVIAHEKVHIVRRDYLIKPIAYLFLVIYWFHPLVFISYVLLCRDIELACDEKVIKELGIDCKKEYSQALLACSIGRKSIAACPVAFGEVGVKQRIKNVLRYRKPTFWMIILAGIVCIVVSVCFMTQKKEDGISDGEIAENTSENNISDQETSDNNTSDNMSDNNTDNLLGKNRHYLESWAEAFCNRDGNTILSMTSSDTADWLEKQGLLDKGDNDASFGYSSPWPVGMGEGKADSYKIVEMDENKAQILYYAWVSEPHITVWSETLNYEIDDGNFVIVSEKLEYLDDIASTEVFYKAYPNGEINNSPMDYLSNTLGNTLNKNAMEEKEEQNSKYYSMLFEPDTAACYLLNIRKNNHEIKTTVSMDNSKSAQVSIEFLLEGKSVDVTMIQPYGEDSIWIPQTKIVQSNQLSTDEFTEVLWQWEEAVSANPKEEMLNQNSGSEKMDGINLLTANEEYNMYLYGLYTKEYGYRGLYFLVDGDLNAMDISWQSMSFGGSENVIRVLEQAENQKPRMFSFIMPDFNTSSSEIWRLFIVDRYDTGTLEMTEFQKEDCFKQAEELIDSTVEEGRLKISSEGQILYDMPLPEGVSDGAIPVFMNNLMSFEANDTNIICHLVIGLQDENEISIGGRPPISFVVDYGDFGQHEIKLKKAYIDDTRVVKEPNRG